MRRLPVGFPGKQISSVAQYQADLLPAASDVVAAGTSNLPAINGVDGIF